MPAHYDHSVVQRSHVTGESQALDLIEEALIETTRERDELSGQRLLWWVRPSTRPVNMGMLLEQRGFMVVEEAEILAFDIVSPDGARRDPSIQLADQGYNWIVARNLDQMRLTHEMRVRNLGNGGPQTFEENEAVADLRALERLETESAIDDPATSSFRLREDEEISIEFLAFDGKTPIATAGLAVRESVANFWGAATEVEYRRRGAYQLLLGARCEVARRLGATLALVKARRGTSGPLLIAAGFRRAGLQTCYALPV